MRDEKEERKKQARSNKQTRQSNTAHPRQSLFHVHVNTHIYIACTVCTCTACITEHLYRVTCCEVTHSLTHSGKKLQELFPWQQSDGDVFQEPPEAHTKLRWQVVQVIFQETGAISEETGAIARETAERGERDIEGESDIEAEFLPSRASRLLQTESQDLVPGESPTPSQLGLCGVIHGLLSWMAGVGFEGIKTTSDIVL